MAVHRVPFGRVPRPNAEIIEVIEQLRIAANRGLVQSLFVIAVNPLHEPETAFAGDLSELRRTVIAGAAAKAIVSLAQDSALPP